MNKDCDLKLYIVDGVLTNRRAKKCQDVPLKQAEPDLVIPKDAEEIIIPEGVRAIRGKAFCGFSSISRVHFPDSLTDIGDSSFEGCEIEKLELPRQLKTIGKRAFYYNRSMKSVSFPEGLQVIEEEAFSWCCDLESLELPDGLKCIGWSAFSHDSRLKRIFLPRGVMVKADAFLGCSSATIECPADLELPADALDPYLLIRKGGVLLPSPLFSFSNVKPDDKPAVALEYLVGKRPVSEKEGKKIQRFIKTHPQKLIALIKQDNAESLSKVLKIADDMPDEMVDDYIQRFNDGKHVSMLAAMLAYKNTRATEQSAEKGMAELPSLELNPSKDWSKIFKYEETDAKIRILRLKQDLSEVEIPDAIDGKPVVWIGKNAFKGRTELRSVRFSAPLTAIQDSAFEGCTALESIDLPDSVEFVGKRAFYNCLALAEVRWPAGLSECGVNAFGYNPYDDIAPRNIRISPDCKKVYLDNLGYSDVTDLYIEGRTTKIDSHSGVFSCPAFASVHIPEGSSEVALFRNIADEVILEK